MTGFESNGGRRVRPANANQLQTGIGRPADAAWTDRVIDTVMRQAPVGTSIKPRTVPGVTYVSGLDWQQAHHIRHVGPETERTAATTMRRLVDKLLEDHVLLPTARKPVEVPCAGIHMKPKNSYYQLIVKIRDDRPEDYPQGTLINGERVATYGALPGPTGRNIPQGLSPLRDVTVGVVRLAATATPADVVNVLSPQYYGQPVPLDRVGIIRAD